MVNSGLSITFRKSDLVERGVRAPGEETVKLWTRSDGPLRAPEIESAHLDQQEQVGVLALGGGTVALLDVVLCDVDTLQPEQPSDRVRVR